MKNYSLFKKDQKKIVNIFCNCYLEIINFFKQQTTNVKKCKKSIDFKKVFNDSIEIDLKNIENIKNILDECIWIIQKHEPRTNHLRLLIAIINSLSDLKRMSNYVVTFTRFFAKYHEKINNKLKTNILNIADFCLQINDSFYKLILKFGAEEMMIESNKLFNKFLKEYKKIYPDFIKESINKKNNPKMMASYIIVLKNIDRNIDHCVNIIENFSSI